MPASTLLRSPQHPHPRVVPREAAGTMHALAPHLPKHQGKQPERLHHMGPPVLVVVVVVPRVDAAGSSAGRLCSQSAASAVSVLLGCAPSRWFSWRCSVVCAGALPCNDPSCCLLYSSLCSSAPAPRPAVCAPTATPGGFSGGLPIRHMYLTLQDPGPCYGRALTLINQSTKSNQPFGTCRPAHAELSLCQAHAAT